MAKWHAHLKTCSLAGLIAFLLGQHIHAVMVFTAKPHLAHLGHPHAGGGLADAVFLVTGADHQFHLAGLRQLGIALQQATAVAGARTQRAQRLQFGVIVIAVETAHHALAAAGGDAQQAFNLERYTGLRLAIGAEGQCLKAQLAINRNPAIGAHARLHSRRPQRRGAAQSLYLAIGISVSGFHQQLTGLLRLGQVGNRDCAQSIAIEHHGQLVSHHLVLSTGRSFLFVAVFTHIAGLAWRVKAKAIPACEVGINVTHDGRYAHWQATGSATGHVVDLHLGWHCADVIQRLFGDRSNPPLQHWQTELFNSENTGGERLTATAAAVGVLQLHAIFTQFGGLGQRHLAFGAQAATGRFVPLERLLEALAAAKVGDLQFIGQVIGQTKAAALGIGPGLGTDEVLHGHGFTSTNQGAVKNRVCQFAAVWIAVQRLVEAPAFNATVPVRARESHVLASFSLAAGADKQRRRAIVTAVVGALIAAGHSIKAGHTFFIGHSRTQQLASAVRDLNLGAGHDLAFIKRCHPGHGVLPAHLEVHGQIGHQYGGAHIHGAALAIALIEQRLAQQGRADFDDVKALGHGDADDFKRTRIALFQLGNLHRLDIRLALEQGQHARLHIVLAAFVKEGGQRALEDTPRLNALEGGLVGAVDLVHPLDDFCVRVCLFGADTAGIKCRGTERGLHIAQRHRQQSRAIDAFGKALNNAKPARGKLGQRRHLARGHSQRKLISIAQAAPATILELRWQLNLVAGFGLHGGWKANIRDQRIGV